MTVKKKKRGHRDESRAAYLFTIPSFVGFLAFVLEEPTLCNALFDYLESLRQSRFVSSREDSLALLSRAAGL